MTLQQEVKEQVVRQLDDGQWHTTNKVWKRTFLELLYNPAYGQKSVNTLAIEAYAAVQQALISLALEERIEVTKDGRIRIKPER
jgi:hypothetical protein